jgi:hypothetical protein
VNSPAALNRSEEYVYHLCNRSFLSLWSYPSPRGKDAKELCDILVVCEPDVIIFSVKEISFKYKGNLPQDIARWKKEAIDKSCRQIYGAERWIHSADHVVKNDGTPGLDFPSNNVRRIHRIAVAIGGGGRLPIVFSDFGKGYIHVLDQRSLSLLLSELDTITDFVEYLNKKENLFLERKSVITGSCSEEDLLALYLHKGRSFPLGHDLIIIDDTLWRAFTNKKQYKAKKKADRDSFVWDRIIESFCGDIINGDIIVGNNLLDENFPRNLMFGRTLNDSERAIRIMARESRFSRRILGKSFMQFMKLASAKKVRARMFRSLSEVVYVFLACPHGEDRQFRVAELGLRCIIARSKFPNNPTIVGIATEQYIPNKGYSFDAMALYLPNWTPQDQTRAEEMEKEFGYFSNPVVKNRHEDEYPRR